MQQNLTPKEALVQLEIQYNQSRYPSFPLVEIQAIAKNKMRKLKTTNGITAAIIAYITYRRGIANRITSAGRQIKKGGKDIYIKSTTKKGTPDIDAIFKGLPIKIEVKNAATNDRMSDEQKKMQSKIEAAGGIYFIATSFDSFYYWWHEKIDIAETPINRA